MIGKSAAAARRVSGMFRRLGVVLALSAGLMGWAHAVKAEPIVLATSKSGWLVWLAQEQGFFKRAGVDVKVELVSSGVAAGAGVLDGKFDLATMSEYAFAARSFSNPDLRVVGTVAAISNVRLVGRRSAGITTAKDLSGKTIGLRRGSIAQFFLGRLLDLNGVLADSIQVADAKPPELPELLIQKKADAIVSWEPYAQQAEDAVGKDAVALTVQGGQPYYFVLATKKDFVERRAGDMERVIRALVQAADFSGASRESSIRILSKRLGISTATMERLWSDHVMDVSLSQDMLSLMEDEAIWRVETGLSKGAVPNFLGFIHADPLLAVDPTRVTIIR